MKTPTSPHNLGRDVRLSVAVPVRSGFPYLEDCIRTVLNGLGENDELVVSLNDCAPQAMPIILKFADSRLRVIETDSLLSMTAHWNFVLSALNGEWVAFLGSDDGAHPNLNREFERLRVRFPNADAYIFRRSYFFWPGAEGIYGKNRLSYRSSRAIVKIYPKVMLWRAIFGKANYLDLPQIYGHGILHRRIITSTDGETGFFRSFSPDVYASVFAACKARQVLWSGTPVFWVGTSGDSNGLALSGEEFKTRSHHEFEELSIRDGFSLGRSLESLSPWRFGQSLLLLSAIENLPPSETIVPNRMVRLLLLVGHLIDANLWPPNSPEAREFLRQVGVPMGNRPFSAMFSTCIYFVKLFRLLVNGLSFPLRALERVRNRANFRVTISSDHLSSDDCASIRQAVDYLKNSDAYR